MSSIVLHLRLLEKRHVGAEFYPHKHSARRVGQGLIFVLPASSRGSPGGIKLTVIAKLQRVPPAVCKKSLFGLRSSAPTANEGYRRKEYACGISSRLRRLTSSSPTTGHVSSLPARCGGPVSRNSFILTTIRIAPGVASKPCCFRVLYQRLSPSGRDRLPQAVSFHIVANSLSLQENSSPLQSSISALFCRTPGCGGTLTSILTAFELPILAGR
jgi:hypothetical protein